MSRIDPQVVKVAGQSGVVTDAELKTALDLPDNTVTELATTIRPSAVVIAGDSADLVAKVNGTTDGVVFIPRGTYAPTSALTPQEGVTLWGEGDDTYIRLPNGSNRDVIDVGEADVTIRNLMVDGNRANQTVKCHAIITVAPRTKVLNCHVKSANGYNIVGYSTASDFQVMNCVSADAGEEAIEFQACDGGIAHGNTVLNSGKSGIYAWASIAANPAHICRDIVISDNLIDGYSSLAPDYAGIHVDDAATQITVSGNKVRGGDGNGIRIASTSANKVEDVTVSGNTIIGAQINGIEVGKAKGVTVIGNTVRGGEQDGIWVSNNASGVVVSGNIISRNKWSGIDLGDSATDWIVSDNICFNNGQDAVGAGGYANGITIYNLGILPDKGIISGNRCYDDQVVKTQEYGLRFHNTIGSSVSVGPNILDGNKLGGQAITSPGATGPSFTPWKLLSNVSVAAAGSSIAHGLPYTPQTVLVFMRSAGTVWRNGAPDGTNVALIADTGTRTCDVLVG